MFIFFKCFYEAYISIIYSVAHTHQYSFICWGAQIRHNADIIVPEVDSILWKSC